MDKVKKEMTLCVCMTTLCLCDDIVYVCVRAREMPTLIIDLGGEKQAFSRIVGRIVGRVEGRTDRRTGQRSIIHVRTHLKN